MSELKVINRPMCQYLRSKGMYVHGTMEPPDEDGLPGSGDGYFWCIKTMQQFGPDSEEATRELCVKGRGCFEAM